MRTRIGSIGLIAFVLLSSRLPVTAATSGASDAGADAASPPAALLLLDAARLADVRARVQRHDPALAPALATLEQNAKAALAMAPVSVMDKGVTPPSGDKHDYMSQAPYWWPDPSKADGRPYIRRDGERNPEINKITDHDALGRVIDAVSTLGLAFHLTGRDEYAAHAAQLVRVWFLDAATRMNPHLRYGQGIPGINEGRGIGIIETRGLPELLDGVTLIAASPAWTSADRTKLDVWMRAYATWLIESPHGQEEAKNGNNHETWYNTQVAALAVWTGQTEMARRAVEAGRRGITAQIEPDGRQPRELERTNSWHYSAFNLEAFFALATLGDRVGVDLWRFRTPDGRSLRQALDFMVPFAAGDRPWTYPEITGFKADVIHDLLRTAAAAWNAPAYRALADRAGGGGARAALTAP
jgi:hypothetical protein